MKDISRAEKLFQENIRLAYWTVSRYYPALITDEDIKQEALLGLWKACLTYNKEKSQFSTYAVKCISSQILMALRKRNRWTRLEAVSLDEHLDEDGELTLAGMVSDPAGSIEDSGVFIEAFIHTLNERDRKVVELKLQGLKQKEAAKELGITQSYYSRLLSDIQRRYTQLEKTTMGGVAV